MTNESERAAFEKWYIGNAFDYCKDPIGSRDCSLQWSAWQARAQLIAEQEKAENSVPNDSVARVAQHIELAINYIEKVYPDAHQLDRGPIMRNMRRWRDVLIEATAKPAPESASVACSIDDTKPVASTEMLDAGDKPASAIAHRDSETLTKVIAEMRSREAVGRAKYGTDVDRNDLTNNDWRQHLREELMDALLYLTAEERTATEQVAAQGGDKKVCTRCDGRGRLTAHAVDCVQCDGSGEHP